MLRIKLVFLFSRRDLDNSRGTTSILSDLCLVVRWVDCSMIQGRPLGKGKRIGPVAYHAWGLGLLVCSSLCLVVQISGSMAHLDLTRSTGIECCHLSAVALPSPL